MSLIQLKDVYKIYAEGQENQVNALDGVTLSIDQGEFVAIIGTSGSGCPRSAPGRLRSFSRAITSSRP